MSDLLSVSLGKPTTSRRSSLSGSASEDSTRSTTPMTGFDFMLDPSDPLAFLMNTSGSDNSGDSSTEESHLGTSTPPSSHGSPSLTNAGQTGNVKHVDESVFAFLTQQAFDDGVQLPFGFGQDFAGMQQAFLDPSIFTENIPDIPVMENGNTPTQHLNAGGDKPAYLANFSRAVAAAAAATPANIAQFHQYGLSSLHYPSRRPSDASSVASPGSSAHMNVDQTPAPLSPFSQASSSSSLEELNPRLSGDQTIDDLAQRAREMVGVSMALPSNTRAAEEQAKLPIPRLQRPMTQSAAVNNRQSSFSSSSSATSVTADNVPAPVQRTKTAHTTIERRYRTNINARIQSLRNAVPALRVLEQKEGNRIGNLNIKGNSSDVIDERGFVDGVKVARKGSKANVLGKATEYIHVLKRRELRLTREIEGLQSLILSLVGGPALLKEWQVMWQEQFGGPETDELNGSEQADAEDDDEEEGEDAEDNAEYGGAATKKRKRSAANTQASKAISSGIMSSVSSATFAPTSHAFTVITPVQTEKKKRGRPRKLPTTASLSPLPNVLPQTASSSAQVPNIMVSTPSSMVMHDFHAQQSAPMSEGGYQTQFQQQHAQYIQPGQYLLAAFAFFSFFNSPIAHYASSMRNSPKHSHGGTHTGVVLDTHSRGDNEWSTARGLDATFGWRDLVQVFHILVSFLLLVSVVGPWLPRRIRRPLTRAVPSILKPILGLQAPRAHSPSVSSHSRSRGSERSSHEDSGDEKEDTCASLCLTSALRCGGLGLRQEMQVLRDALGLQAGVFGFVSSLFRLVMSSSGRGGHHRLRRRMLEQRAFLRLAELVALDGNSTVIARIQTYLHAFKFISASSASASDAATLALVLRPVWPTKAAAFWELARSRINCSNDNLSRVLQAAKPYEKYVLESMDVDEAAEKIDKFNLDLIQPSAKPNSAPVSSHEGGEDAFRFKTDSSGPLAVLARHIVRDFVRTKAETTFIRTVLDDRLDAYVDYKQSEDDDHDSDTNSIGIISAGLSLDETTADLMDLYERACLTDCMATPATLPDDYSDSEEDLDDDELQATSDEDDEIRSLLHSILLFRQLFPSTLLKVGRSTAVPPTSNTSEAWVKSSGIQRPSLLSKPSRTPIAISLTPMPSPPPSPSERSIDSSRVGSTHLSLRRRLASAAFDRSDLLEDARDHVVDMLAS